MISLAGIPVADLPPEEEARLKDAIPLWMSAHQAAWTEPGGTEGGLWPPMSPRFNSLYWPAGASRWACGFFAADEECLAACRLQQSQQSKVSYLADDGTGGTFSCDLLLLPAVPLERASLALPALWLLPLADDRWRWRHCSGAVSITGGSTTWAALYAAIGTLLGITITVDAVDSAYLYPSPRLAQASGPLPPLLDAVARSVGQRIIRSPDGTVRAMSASESLRLHEANLQAQDQNRLDGHRPSTGGYMP